MRDETYYLRFLLASDIIVALVAGGVALWQGASLLAIIIVACLAVAAWNIILTTFNIARI